MTNNSADHHPGNSVAEGSYEGDFGCSVMDLRNLMELRSAEAVTRINDTYGGVHNICKRLKTSPVEGKEVITLVGKQVFPWILKTWLHLSPPSPHARICHKVTFILFSNG